MTSTIGIPIKLLNEAEVRSIHRVSKSRSQLTIPAQGHIVTLEITSGTTYRGKLLEGMSPYPATANSNNANRYLQPKIT